MSGVSHSFQEASKWVASARNLSCFSTLKIFLLFDKKMLFIHVFFSFLFLLSFCAINLSFPLSLSALFLRTALYFWVSCQPQSDISPYVAACTDALIWSDWLCRFFNSDIAYCQKQGESCAVQWMMHLCLYGWFASCIQQEIEYYIFHKGTLTVMEGWEDVIANRDKKHSGRVLCWLSIIGIIKYPHI